MSRWGTRKETKHRFLLALQALRMALVLTGTPLKNRIDELFFVIEFLDNRKLGPGERSLTITLPDESALQQLAETLARFAMINQNLAPVNPSQN